MAAERGQTDYQILVCDCEGSSPLDVDAIAKSSGREPDFCGTQLCRRQLQEVQSRLSTGRPLLIGCTQEAPLFLEIARDEDYGEDLRFVNIREKAGWSRQGNEIVRSFQFADHHQAMAFVNAVAWISHAQNHHPQMDVGYNTVTIQYATHSVGGLSRNDFICAARVNALS